MTEAPMDLMAYKLRRADDRLRGLKRQLDTFARRHPIIVGTELDFETGWHTSYIRNAEPLPQRFAIPVGESLYHGRSVLDHLVWALVIANGQRPGKQHEFPILQVPPDPRRGESAAAAFIRTNGVNKLVGVHRDAMEAIEDLQPYNRPREASYVLTVLHEMARDDRHHALHVGWMIMADPRNMAEPRLSLPRGVVLTAWEPLFRAEASLDVGTRLGRFRVSRYRRNVEVGLQADLPVLVAFGERRPLVLGEFHTINAELRKLLGRFERFF